MDPAAFVPLGRIVKTHGLAGEVSVLRTGTLPLERSVGIEAWIVPPPAGVRSCVIDGVRPGPKGPLVKLAGVDDPDTAASLRGLELRIRVSDLPDDACEPEPDPCGLRVIDAERGEIGTVEDVIVTGANDVWVVRGSAYGEILVPVIEQVIEQVDFESMTANVRLLPGLIEGE